MTKLYEPVPSRATTLRVFIVLPPITHQTNLYFAISIYQLVKATMLMFVVTAPPAHALGCGHGVASCSNVLGKGFAQNGQYLMPVDNLVP
jgi:hypothetical protein